MLINFNLVLQGCLSQELRKVEEKEFFPPYSQNSDESPRYPRLVSLKDFPVISVG